MAPCGRGLKGKKGNGVLFSLRASPCAPWSKGLFVFFVQFRGTWFVVCISWCPFVPRACGLFVDKFLVSGLQLLVSGFGRTAVRPYILGGSSYLGPAVLGPAVLASATLCVEKTLLCFGC